MVKCKYVPSFPPHDIFQQSQKCSLMFCRVDLEEGVALIQVTFIEYLLCTRDDSKSLTSISMLDHHNKCVIITPNLQRES